MKMMMNDEIFNLLDSENQETPLLEEQGLKDVLNLIDREEDEEKNEERYNLNFDFLNK